MMTNSLNKPLTLPSWWRLAAKAAAVTASVIGVVFLVLFERAITKLGTGDNSCLNELPTLLYQSSQGYLLLAVVAVAIAVLCVGLLFRVAPWLKMILPVGILVLAIAAYSAISFQTYFCF